jgi:hypothetical protein
MSCPPSPSQLSSRMLTVVAVHHVNQCRPGPPNSALHFPSPFMLVVHTILVSHALHLLVRFTLTAKTTTPAEANTRPYPVLSPRHRTGSSLETRPKERRLGVDDGYFRRRGDDNEPRADDERCDWWSSLPNTIPNLDLFTWNMTQRYSLPLPLPFPSRPAVALNLSACRYTWRWGREAGTREDVNGKR